MADLSGAIAEQLQLNFESLAEAQVETNKFSSMFRAVSSSAKNINSTLSRYGKNIAAVNNWTNKSIDTIKQDISAKLNNIKATIESVKQFRVLGLSISNVSKAFGVIGGVIKSFGQKLSSIAGSIGRGIKGFGSWVTGGAIGKNIFSLPGLFNAIKVGVGLLFVDILKLNTVLSAISKNFGLNSKQAENYGKILTDVRGQLRAYGVDLADVAEGQKNLIQAFKDMSVGADKSLVNATTLLTEFGLQGAEAAELVRSLVQDLGVPPAGIKDTVEGFGKMITSGTSMTMLLRDMASSTSLMALRNGDNLEAMVKMSEYAVRTGQSTNSLIAQADNMLFNSESTFKNLGMLQNIANSRMKDGTVNLEKYRNMLQQYAEGNLEAGELQRVLLKDFSKFADAGLLKIPQVRKSFTDLLGMSLEDINKIAKAEERLEEQRKKQNELGYKPFSFEEALAESTPILEKLKNIFFTPFNKLFGDGTAAAERNLSSMLNKVQIFVAQYSPTFDELLTVFNNSGRGIEGLKAAALAFLRPWRNYFNRENLGGKIKDLMKQSISFTQKIIENYIGPGFRAVVDEFAPYMKTKWDEVIKPFLKDSFIWLAGELGPPMKNVWNNDIKPVIIDIFEKLKPIFIDLGKFAYREISIGLYELTKDNTLFKIGTSRETFEIADEMDKLKPKAAELGISLTDRKLAEKGTTWEDYLTNVSYGVSAGAVMGAPFAGVGAPIGAGAGGIASFIMTATKDLTESVDELGEKFPLTEEGLESLKASIELQQNLLKETKQNSNSPHGLWNQWDWGGARAVGGVFNRPTLAMIGEEGRDEVVIPTGRIREGLPINSAVASQLSSIGVPGFQYGGHVAIGQAIASSQNLVSQNAMYMQGGDPAQIRKRDQDMRNQNEAYINKLKQYHDEIFEGEKRLSRYNGRNYRRFGRDVGMFGKYTSLISKELKNTFETGTFADAVAEGLATWFETEDLGKSLRAGFDAGMRSDGFIYKGIEGSTSNVQAAGAQGAYNRFRAWEEGGRQGGRNEGLRLTALGYVERLMTTRYNSGEYKGKTFGESMGMKMFGQNADGSFGRNRKQTASDNPKELQQSVADNTGDTADAAEKRVAQSEKLAEDIQENAAAAQEKADQMNQLLAKSVESSTEGDIAVADAVNESGKQVVTAVNDLGKQLQSANPTTNSNVGLRNTGLGVDTSNPVNLSNLGGISGTQERAQARLSGSLSPKLDTSNPVDYNKLGGISGTQERAQARLRDLKGVGDPKIELQGTVEEEGLSFGQRLGGWVSSQKAAAAQQLGSIASAAPAAFGQSAMQGLMVGLQTGDAKQGLKAGAAAFEQKMLMTAFQAGPWGMAAGAAYLVGKSLYKRSQRKKAKKSGRELADRTFGRNSDFTRMMQKKGFIPYNIPFTLPKNKHAQREFLKRAPQSLQESFKYVFGKYITDEESKSLANMFIMTNGQGDQGFIDSVMENIVARSQEDDINIVQDGTTGRMGIATGMVKAEPGQINQNSTYEERMAYHATRSNGRDSESTYSLGGGAYAYSAVNAMGAYTQGGYMSASQAHNNQLIEEVRELRRAMNITVNLDGRKVGEGVTDAQAQSAAGF